MTPFTSLTAVAAPLIRNNVDTDAIIPSREMRAVSRQGLAAGLFAGWRYTAIGGRERVPGFVLNRPEYAGAAILLAGDNFGCGSSREHAVWALAEFGIRAVLAPSFAPIFHGNCVRNGVLPAALPAVDIAALAAVVEADPVAGALTVDLQQQCVRAPGAGPFPFTIDAESRAMLLGGLDAIAMTLARTGAIDAYLSRDRIERPWIYLPGAAAERLA